MRRSIGKGLRVTAALAAATLVMAGCGGGSSGRTLAQGGWDAVVKAAKAEGSVTVYSSQGKDVLDKLTGAFQAQYPEIKVRVVRDSDANLDPKIEAEANTGNATGDVYLGARTTWFDQNKDKFVAPVGPAFDDPGYNKATNLSAENTFLVDVPVLTFGWNTKLVPQGLKDYPDLLAPELKGKVGVVSENTASRVQYFTYLRQHYGDDFIAKLAGQQPRVYDSALTMEQALGSGEIAAGMYVEVLDAMKATGAPVESGYAPTAWGARYDGVVLKAAHNPNAAQLFANFMITKEGQAAIASLGASVLPGVPGVPKDISQIAPLTPETVTTEQVRAAEDAWKKLYNR